MIILYIGNIHRVSVCCLKLAVYSKANTVKENSIFADTFVGLFFFDLKIIYKFKNFLLFFLGAREDRNKNAMAELFLEGGRLPMRLYR